MLRVRGKSGLPYVRAAFFVRFRFTFCDLCCNFPSSKGKRVRVDTLKLGKMVGNMKLKVALLATVIGLSSQASMAATDTSCNPFARGSDCNGAAAAADKEFGSFGKRAFRSNHFMRDMAPTGRWENARRGSEARQLGRLLRRGEGPRFDEEPSFEDSLDEEIVLDEGGANDEDVAVVPIPASGALLLVGLGGIAAMRRKKS